MEYLFVIMFTQQKAYSHFTIKILKELGSIDMQSNAYMHMLNIKKVCTLYNDTFHML